MGKKYCRHEIFDDNAKYSSITFSPPIYLPTNYETVASRKFSSYLVKDLHVPHPLTSTSVLGTVTFSFMMCCSVEHGPSSWNGAQILFHIHLCFWTSAWGCSLLRESLQGQFTHTVSGTSIYSGASQAPGLWIIWYFFNPMKTCCV